MRQGDVQMLNHESAAVDPHRPCDATRTEGPAWRDVLQFSCQLLQCVAHKTQGGSMRQATLPDTPMRYDASSRKANATTSTNNYNHSEDEDDDKLATATIIVITGIVRIMVIIVIVAEARRR